MAPVKFKSEEEYQAFQKKMAREVPVEKNPLETKGPEDQKIKVYTRPDAREGAEQPPSEQLERQELNRKLRESQREKEKESEESFSEKHPKIAGAVEAVKSVGHGIKEELKRVSKNAEKVEPKEEEEEYKPSKKSKKSKHIDIDEDFGEDSKSMSTRSSGRKPFSEDYKEVYSGKKVMAGDYKEVYRGQMGSEEYTQPKVPKTHGGFLQHEERTEQNQPRTQPQQQRAPQARAPMEMPRVGSFGSGNVKMPTMSFGGSGSMPKVVMPSTGNHKVGKGGNMPSINIPTLGGSTLLPGMGKKMGSFNIPKIENWGKAPLKTELNLPSIGNLTIMGAGKKGGIRFGLGEIPSFSLGAPQKKKKK